MSTRDERVQDLFLLPGSANPTEEGLVRRFNDDLRTFLGGSLLSLFQPVIHRTILGDLTVVAGTTMLHRDMVIPDGMTVTIDDDGELLIL